MVHRILAMLGASAILLASQVAYAQFAEAPVDAFVAAADVTPVAATDVVPAAPTDAVAANTVTDVSGIVVVVPNVPNVPTAAQLEYNDIGQLIGKLPVIVQMFKDGNYRVGVAALLSFIVSLFLVIFSRIAWVRDKILASSAGRKAIPWIGTGISVIASVAVLLPYAAWYEILITALSIGAMSAGIWEKFLVHFMPKPSALVPPA